MASLDDRRRHPRYPINLPVFIFHAEKRAVGHTLDVGLGGMKIYTDKVFAYRQEFLFQLVLQRKSVRVKGRFVFEQTHPELVNFSCIQFEELSKENVIDLQEVLLYAQNLLKKGGLDMEFRIREKEAELAEVNDLSKVEAERRKRGEHFIRKLVELLGFLSSAFLDDREKRLRMTVQGLDDGIEALLLAITKGLNNIYLFLKEGNVADQISFEQSILSIQENYKEVRKVLENLGPSISDELRILRTIGGQCQELQNIFYALQSGKEEDVPEDFGCGEIQYVQVRRGN